MNYILARFSEPATYAGIGVALGALGIAIPQGYAHDLVLVGMATAGSAAVVIKEGWRKALSSGDAAAAVVTSIEAAKVKRQ
jgi:nitrogen fixation protein